MNCIKFIFFIYAISDIKSVIHNLHFFPSLNTWMTCHALADSWGSRKLSSFSDSLTSLLNQTASFLYFLLGHCCQNNLNFITEWNFVHTWHTRHHPIRQDRQINTFYYLIGNSWLLTNWCYYLHIEGLELIRRTPLLALQVLSHHRGNILTESSLLGETTWSGCEEGVRKSQN